MKTKNLFPLVIIIFLFSVMSLRTVAQIVYTDIPDLTSPSSNAAFNYNLDLNNDGIVDFVITHYTVKITGCHGGKKTDQFITISPNGGNQVLSYGASTPYWVIKLNVNNIITPTSLTWWSSANQVISKSYYNCDPFSGRWEFIPGTNWVDQYVGLKLIVNGSAFYGWLRMSSIGASEFTIKDYAYDSTPDHSIIAGTTSGARLSNEYSQKELDLSLSVFPNPVFEAAKISFSLSHTQYLSIKIWDMKGKLVGTLANDIFKTGVNQVAWDVSNINEGIYILQIQTDGYSKTERLIVRK